MSKLEKTKALIDFIKAVIIALLVGLFGMMSYLVVNLEKITSNQAIMTTVGIIIDLIILAVFTRVILKKINELEKL